MDLNNNNNQVASVSVNEETLEKMMKGLSIEEKLKKFESEEFLEKWRGGKNEKEMTDRELLDYLAIAEKYYKEYDQALLEKNDKAMEEKGYIYAVVTEKCHCGRPVYPFKVENSDSSLDKCFFHVERYFQTPHELIETPSSFIRRRQKEYREYGLFEDERIHHRGHVDYYELSKQICYTCGGDATCILVGKDGPLRFCKEHCDQWIQLKLEKDEHQRKVKAFKACNDHVSTLKEKMKRVHNNAKMDEGFDTKLKRTYFGISVESWPSDHGNTGLRLVPHEPTDKVIPPIWHTAPWGTESFFPQKCFLADQQGFEKVDHSVIKWRLQHLMKCYTLYKDGILRITQELGYCDHCGEWMYHYLFNKRVNYDSPQISHCGEYIEENAASLWKEIEEKRKRGEIIPQEENCIFREGTTFD